MTASAKNTSFSPLAPNIDYHKKRYFIFFLVAVIALALPFIKINGHHFFLLSFDHQQLHLFFTAFDMQEMYLMPFLLILMFLGIFFITTLAGRVWCGWGCPQTIFRTIYRDFIEHKLGLSLGRKNRQKEGEKSTPKRILALILIACICAAASANLMWYFIPPEDFFSYLQNPLDHKYLFVFWFVLFMLLFSASALIKENFCIYMCPYARIQSVLYDDDTIATFYDYKRGGVVWSDNSRLLHKKAENGEYECVMCESCVRVCPTHIDIRKGIQLECINCLECADACAKTQSKFGKASLINWTSANAVENRKKVAYARFRTIAYVVAMSAVFIGLLYAIGTKENMLLNINRSTEIYSINTDGSVENPYIFLVQNTDNVEHKYYFEILDENGAKDTRFVIKRPDEPFSVKPGEKLKQIVLLETKENLSNGANTDVVVHLKIRAFSVDNPEISVMRESVFIYPPKK